MDLLSKRFIPTLARLHAMQTWVYQNAIPIEVVFHFLAQ